MDLRILLPACALLVLPSCDQAPSQAAKPDEPRSEAVGFEAVITGSYEAKVSGRGVLFLLPTAGFDKQGYLFLADGRGLRPHGVTFILPRGLAPGRHPLTSPAPLDIGKVPSVRVDRDMGATVQSADRNTAGYLDLAALPDADTDLNGSAIIGSFEFRTENPKGERIAVTGSFSFKAE